MNRRHFLKLMVGGAIASSMPLSLVLAEPVKKSKFVFEFNGLPKGDYTYSYHAKPKGSDIWARHIKTITVETDGDSLEVTTELNKGDQIARWQFECANEIPYTKANNIIKSSAKGIRVGGDSNISISFDSHPEFGFGIGEAIITGG